MHTNGFHAGVDVVAVDSVFCLFEENVGEKTNYFHKFVVHNILSLKNIVGKKLSENIVVKIVI